MRVFAEAIGWLVIGTTTLCFLLLLGVIIYAQIWEWRQKRAEKKEKNG